MNAKYAILTVLFFILAFAPVVVKADVNKDLSKQFSQLSQQMDDLQRAEQRLQQPQGGYYQPTSVRNVVGYLDEAREDGIYGWAWDPDAGANPIQINIYVDGKFAKTVTADQERPDIYVDPSRPVGSKHGYSWKNHGLTGTHSIEAFGVDHPKGTEESLGVKTYYGSGASNPIPPSYPQPSSGGEVTIPVLLVNSYAYDGKTVTVTGTIKNKMELPYLGGALFVEDGGSSLTISYQGDLGKNFGKGNRIKATGTYESVENVIVATSIEKVGGGSSLALILIVVVVIVVVVILLLYFLVMKGPSGGVPGTPTAPSAAPSKVPPPPAKKKVPPAPKK